MNFDTISLPFSQQFVLDSKTLDSSFRHIGVFKTKSPLHSDIRQRFQMPQLQFTDQGKPKKKQSQSVKVPLRQIKANQQYEVIRNQSLHKDARHYAEEQTIRYSPCVRILRKTRQGQAIFTSIGKTVPTIRDQSPTHLISIARDKLPILQQQQTPYYKSIQETLKQQSKNYKIPLKCLLDQLTQEV